MAQIFIRFAVQTPSQLLDDSLFLLL